MRHACMATAAPTGTAQWPASVSRSSRRLTSSRQQLHAAVLWPCDTTDANDTTHALPMTSTRRLPGCMGGIGCSQLITGETDRACMQGRTARCTDILPGTYYNGGQADEVMRHTRVLTQALVSLLAPRGISICMRRCFFISINSCQFVSNIHNCRFM